MAISTSVNVVQTALWPQGDARDPLGVWGSRIAITGDASGGSIKVQHSAAADRRRAYVYTCYHVIGVQLTGSITANTFWKTRLLTNWPDISPETGIVGFSTFSAAVLQGTAGFTAPEFGPGMGTPALNPLDRFILLFDPRSSSGALPLVETEWGENVDLATYVFETYGYFWDLAVMQAPGGPRHPGSS